MGVTLSKWSFSHHHRGHSRTRVWAMVVAAFLYTHCARCIELESASSPHYVCIHAYIQPVWTIFTFCCFNLKDFISWMPWITIILMALMSNIFQVQQRYTFRLVLLAAVSMNDTVCIRVNYCFLHLSTEIARMRKEMEEELATNVSNTS